MKKIVDYLLLYAGAIGSLNEEVQGYVRVGWEPLGAPFVASIEQPLFYQAVVRREM